MQAVGTFSRRCRTPLPRSITVGDKTATLEEWAQALGLNHQTMRVTVGNTTASINEWAEVLGCTTEAIYKRMRIGLSPEEAVSIRKHSRYNSKRRA